MDEKLIVVLAIIASLAGVFLLFLFAERLNYDEVTIEKINNERMSEMIKIKGEVTSVNNIGNVTFIKIRQPNYMDVIVFEEIKLDSGQTVEIIGQTEEYENKMEIIAHRLRAE